MKNGCLTCREGLQALEERLCSGNYRTLQELQLCDTCCKALLESVSTTTMIGEHNE